MKKVLLVIVLSVFCNYVYSQTEDLQKKEIDELKARIELLEQKVELLDKMVAQNTELAKTNRTLNKQLGQLMKALHPKELAKMNP